MSRYNEDKTQYRTGIIPSEELVNVMLNEVKNARAVISKEKLDKKIPLTIKELKDAIDNIRGAVMIVYPAYHGLPEWEPVRLILENKFEWENIPTDVYDVISL